MNLKQEQIDCKANLLNNINALKVVMDNFALMVGNSNNYLDSYKVDNEMCVINYFLDSIRNDVKWFKNIEKRFIDEVVNEDE